MDMEEATRLHRKLTASGKLSPAGSPPPPKSTSKDKKQGTAGMKLSKAKDLYEYGVVMGAEIVDNPLKEGWLVQIKSRTGDVSTLETDRGGLRVFKTLDAAFKTCEEIGLETALVARKR